ncbi:MAG: outer membrane protein assembly factor BamD [bacterium]
MVQTPNKQYSSNFTGLRVALFSFLTTIILFSSCAKKTKSKDDMSFEDLKKNALTLLEQKKYEKASEYIEKMVSRFPDHAETHKHKLILADTYFKMGHYPSAEKLYTHYATYYPSDQKAEYSQYRAIRSQFYQTLRLDCDQTATEDTINLCKTYRNIPTYAKYLKDVVDIQSTCEHKLINKEIYVYNFYLRKKKYDAAQNRLAYLRSNYVPKKKSLEPRILYLECKLAQKQKNKKILDEKLEQLATQHPESQYTRMAQSLISRSKFEF